ncbi:unnamed protein product [Adineta ricciae]|uniref:Uncharacterized protein n=1 Tax=Adineta ricciae TaxID=249248 RepID=A0A815LB34_ADIRI|nr:unnamed protein product [Adineta ricciae]
MDEGLLEIKLRGNGKNGLGDILGYNGTADFNVSSRRNDRRGIIFSNMNDIQDAISSVVVIKRLIIQYYKNLYENTD